MIKRWNSLLLKVFDFICLQNLKSSTVTVVKETEPLSIASWVLKKKILNTFFTELLITTTFQY